MQCSLGPAEPLQIHGTTGYAGEYELSGSVMEQDLEWKKVFSGPLTVKHVGLCTHDGPKETVGAIWFRTRQFVLTDHCNARFRWKQVHLQWGVFRVVSRLHGLRSWRAAFRYEFGPNDPTPSGVRARARPHSPAHPRFRRLSRQGGDWDAVLGSIADNCRGVPTGDRSESRTQISRSYMGTGISPAAFAYAERREEPPLSPGMEGP